MPQAGASKSRLPSYLNWVSTAISVLILGAFVAFYFFQERKTTRLAVERDLRLLGIGSDALVQSIAKSANAHVLLDHDKCDGVWVEIPPPDATESKGDSGGGKANSFCVTFEAILGFVPRGEQAFDKRLLVNQEGRVLGQAGRPEVPNLTSLTALKTFADGKATEEPLQLASLGPIMAVHFGNGEQYRLFCQAASVLDTGPAAQGAAKNTADSFPWGPADAPAKGPEPEAKPLPPSLQLCGLASEDRLHTHWQLSQPLVLLLCALLATTVLVPPFLRMRLLSPTQRFRFADAFALCVCVLFTLMLITVAARGVITQLRIESFVDTQLEHLATSMSANLSNELAVAKSQLEASNVSGEPGVRSVKQDEWTKHGQTEAMSWADYEGRMNAKVTSLPLERQGAVSVANRPYFRRGLTTKSPDFVIDSVRSYSSGKSRGVLARYQEDPTGTKGVLVLTLPIQSIRVPLPDGMTFAVVNGAGDVLLHSEPALSNSHNLLTECEKNSELAALLDQKRGKGGEGRIEDLSYFGVDHRAYVKTIDVGESTSHLSLIVFQESAQLRAMVVETVGGALASSVMYASVWLVIVVGYLLVGGRRNTGWLWPQKRRKHAYVGLFFWFLVLICFALGVIIGERAPGSPELPQDQQWTLTSWAHANWPRLFMFAVPLVVVLSALFVFSLGRPAVQALFGSNGIKALFGTRAKKLEVTYWRAYCVTATAFWLLCAVIPSYVFGSFALDSAARHFADHRAASFEARAHQPDEDPPPATAPEQHAECCAPDLFIHAKTLGLDGSGEPPFVRDLVNALDGSPSSSDPLRKEDRFWMAWVVFWSFWALIGPMVFLIVSWLSRTVLLRGSGAHRLLNPSELAPLGQDLWCIVASRRALEAFPRTTSDNVLPIQSGVSGTFFGARPDPGLLEKLTDVENRGKKPQIVLANQTPLAALSALQKEASSSPSLLANWTSALRTFRVGYLPDASPLEDQVAELRKQLAGRNFAHRRYDWLSRELCSSVYVYSACHSLPTGCLASVERRAGLRLVRDAAWHYYWELWNACSPQEQLTLVQLTEEGFVNEQRREVVRVLLGRGIVRRRPMLAPLNDSFASFVCIRGMEAELSSQEASPTGFSWQHLRPPLVVLFACTSYFLFFTERSLFDSTLAYATTLAALVPHLGRFAAAAMPSGQRTAAAATPAADTAVT